MNKYLKAPTVFLASILLIVPLFSSAANALSFQPNRIIDDTIFNNADSMTAAGINNFLNQYSSSCISPNNGFAAPDPTGYSPSNGFQYGGNVTAGQVIYDAAQAYSINPQVLLSTLQKEQSLVTGDQGCTTLRYAAAVGYGCPDGGTTYNYSNVDLYTIHGTTVTSVTGTCVNTSAKVGFSQQIIRGAWLLKFGQQRSLGNIGWAVIKGSWDNSDDPQSCYSGPMTQGTWQRCPSGGSAYYDGYTTIDNTATHMDTGATASLYWYTPHFSGNQSFFNIFLGWFGSPYSGTCISSMSNVSTDVQFNDTTGNRAASGNFIIDSGASTNCVEFHTWSSGLNTWSSHTASNSASVDTANSAIEYADLTGSGTRTPILIGLKGTASGMIEFHIWNSDLQTWSQHIITNAPCIDTTISQVRFADLNGDGKDEGILVGEANGSTSTGKIEFHIWNPGFQTWNTHIVSNSSTLDPNISDVQFADLDGSGKDTGVLIGEANGSTSSGHIEFHVWNPGLTSWRSHIISNSPTLDPHISKIQFANVNSDGKDRGVLIGLRPGGTGSGNIEFHIWSQGLNSWDRHIISNQPVSPN